MNGLTWSSAGLRRWVLGLFLVDCLATPAVMAAALWMRYGFEPPLRHVEAYLLFVPAIALLRPAIGYVAGSYDFRHRLTPGDYIFGALGESALGIAATYGVLLAAKVYYDPAIEFSRLVAVMDFALLAVWFALSRLWVQRALIGAGYGIRALLIGRAEECENLRGELSAYAPKLIRVTEIIATDGIAETEVDAALRAVGEFDQAILTDTDIAAGALRALLRRCDSNGAEIYLHPELGASLMTTTHVADIAGVPLVPIGTPLTFSRYRIAKRGMDIAIASVALVLALPLFAAVALAVRVFMGRPVFYVQRRVGHRGREFTLFKFRSMEDNAEAASGPVLAQKDDHRITALGKLLRTTRADELPQLWNVLRGDMSLVGPRPERKVFHDEFSAKHPLYERRHALRPGLTGLAQIHGRYDTSAEQKLRYDLIYINGVSLVTDLRILLATIRVVLTGKGAR